MLGPGTGFMGLFKLPIDSTHAKDYKYHRNLLMKAVLKKAVTEVLVFHIS